MPGSVSEAVPGWVAVTWAEDPLFEDDGTLELMAEDQGALEAPREPTVDLEDWTGGKGTPFEVVPGILGATLEVLEDCCGEDCEGGRGPRTEVCEEDGSLVETLDSVGAGATELPGCGGPPSPPQVA